MISNAQSSIVVDNVGKTYFPSPPWMKAMVRTNITEPVVALEGIDFKVNAGEIVAVVGPNGAGKTTTFRILVGLTTPTAGSATIMGYDTTRQSTAVRALVGWMPGDDRSLLMRLTCAENLRFHGRLQGMKPKGLDRRVKETLELVGMGHAAKKTIFALSAGMRARIQLARALLHDPKVLILDEPTSAVDPVAAHDLLNLIMGVVEERQLAALLSSHRLEEIESLHSRMILLDRGQIRYDGDLDTMRNRLDRPCLQIRFTNDDAAGRAAKTLDASGIAESVSMDGDGMVRIILGHGTAQGSVLNELDGHLIPEIVHFEEVQRPLRDLLTEIYDNALETGGKTTDEKRRNRRQGAGRVRQRR